MIVCLFVCLVGWLVCVGGGVCCGVCVCVVCVVCGWGEKVGEWGEEEKGNCTYISTDIAEEEVAKLIVGNDCGICKASFAGDVRRMFSLIKNSFCV